MSNRPSRVRAFTDSLGLEIDRLIKQLPGADPTLRGDEAEARPLPRDSRQVSPIGTQGTTPSSTRESLGESAERARRRAVIGVWLRTTAAVALGIAMLQWPYARDCGWSLDAYLGAVGAVLVAASWASWSAWRLHVAAAHIAGLVVTWWGAVLAAEQVLPRIGYAAVEATWRCTR